MNWEAMEEAIARQGITLDRPKHSRHPHFPEIVYPIDYGYVNGVPGADGEELDVFVGTAATGLVGVCTTRDFRKGDTEQKLLYNCTAGEVYLVHGFLNFAPDKMTSSLTLRHDMAWLWERTPT